MREACPRCALRERYCAFGIDLDLGRLVEAKRKVAHGLVDGNRGDEDHHQVFRDVATRKKDAGERTVGGGDGGKQDNVGVLADDAQGKDEKYQE